MAKLSRSPHTRYAQGISRRMGWRDHLWQGRYFSSPLDEQYCWAAIRYVERNPVRARSVVRA
jgi:putative transposase